MKKILFVLLSLLLLTLPNATLDAAKDKRKSSYQTEPAEQTVYITRTGHKYHRPSCHHLRRSAYPLSKAEARERGYGACKICRP